MAEQDIPKDWFDFMQKMWNPMSYPLPGMITPTVNIEEIDKKIGELKSVETWLTMNTGFVQMTIKTLQMQKAALESLRAAEQLQKDGVSCEVIDLATLSPIDHDTILESVAKTNRVIILHEAPLTGGVGGEFAARIAEKAFDYLDAPIKRVAALDTPVPYSPPLEEFYLPNKDKVVAAARELLAY